MKTLITASLLLAFASPAFAASANPRDFPDILKLEDLGSRCTHGVFPEDEKGFDPGEPHPERDKVCADAAKLEKKLAARGYCTYARSVVGRTGKKYFYPGIDSAGTNSHMARHCYIITNIPRK